MTRTELTAKVLEKDQKTKSLQKSYAPLENAELFDDVATQTFRTPVKRTANIIDSRINTRMRQCPGGCAVYSLKQNNDRLKKACRGCGVQTEWQCLTCCFYYCITPGKAALKDPQFAPPYFVVKQSREHDWDEKKDLRFRKSCFLLAHKSQIQCSRQELSELCNQENMKS